MAKRRTLEERIAELTAKKKRQDDKRTIEERMRKDRAELEKLRKKR